MKCATLNVGFSLCGKPEEIKYIKKKIPIDILGFRETAKKGKGDFNNDSFRMIQT